jgi:hypothetical protein
MAYAILRMHEVLQLRVPELDAQDFKRFSRSEAEDARGGRTYSERFLVPNASHRRFAH